ncbi:hypothetical protein GCM10020358_47110 [Amorphoplanes nipponensis]|uniref:hypothetical protein n=1 Tax=Actinoplanes nipponensis TaxID=135950 RepID=UPI0031F17D9B
MDAADGFWTGRWVAGGAARGPDRDRLAPANAAWADAVAALSRGCALAVDYGHLRSRGPRSAP